MSVPAGFDSVYDPTTPGGVVRLLLNDVADPMVFSEDEIAAFLTLEGGNIKLAAAQAIDTNATNEVLASKVLRTQDLTTDGAKVADAMRKHATSLREQAASEDGYFDLVDVVGSCYSWGPELTERRGICWP